MARPAFLIPAYQPGATLVQLIRALRALGDTPVIVVDDGSDAACAPVFEALAAIEGVTVLAHAKNQGKGAALQTGLRHAQALPDLTGVVTLDADGQHRPEDASCVADELIANPQALVLGCRAFPTGLCMPLRSRVGNLVTRRLLKVLTGLALTDSQTGLRGIPRGFIPSLLAVKAGGYAFEMEMLLQAARLKIPIQQVAIATIYIDDNACSHFRPIRDSARIYAALWRFAVRSDRS